MLLHRANWYYIIFLQKKNMYIRLQQVAYCANRFQESLRYCVQSFDNALLSGHQTHNHCALEIPSE